MKLINTFDAITISTNITAEQLSKAEKYAPESLILVEDKQPIFAINVAGKGSVNKNGIVFDGVSRDGTLYVTMTNEAISGMSEEDAHAMLEENFGMVLFRLKQVEDQVELAIGIATENIATVSAAITIG